jgi:EAL domain-containing protein (putative c-di-GMP-specific phosphodiesterase class I)
VHQILLETGLSPARLELEITETAMITDMERTTHILRQLKALGLSIAMDDFGTGYSSLSTLRAFPFDKIKLDRSFMSELDGGPQSSAIIRAVLALGESLEIPVLAEGVETLEQLSFLRAQGCNEAQGYLLGRPKPVAEPLIQNEAMVLWTESRATEAA